MKMGENTQSNENTSEVAEPIVKHGGDSLTTFDDLEAVSSLPTPSEAKAKKEQPKAAKGADSQDADEDSDEGDDDEEGSGSKGEKKPEKKDTESDKIKGAKKEVEKDRARVKLYKVKNGDTELDLAADAKFTVPVNGKPQEISFQDLVSEFSGKTDWNRRYSELNTERKTFESARSNFLDKAISHVKSGNIEGYAEHILGVAGFDGQKVMSEYREKLFEEFEAEKDLPPEERRARALERDNKKLLAERDARLSDETQKKQFSAIESHVEKLRKDHEIDVPTFLRAHRELAAEGHLNGFDDQKSATFVAKYVVETRAREQLSGLLVEVDPAMKGELLAGAIETLRKVQLDNPDFTEADLKEIANQSYGSKAIRKLSAKIKNGGSESTTRKQSFSPQRDPISFDDIE